MRQKPTGRPSSSEQIIRDIKRKTRKQYSAEEKIRIALDGLRGEDSIAELCRREGIAQSLYYKWSKDFMEAGKNRLAGKRLKQLVPVANYDGQLPLTAAQLQERALLDTFDWLAPQYDQPQTAAKARQWLEQAGLKDVEVLRAGHLVGRGVKGM